jgi:DNA (cytosine-5)-methyltransferase 1
MFVPGVAATIDCRNLYENEELSGTLQHKDKGGWSLNYINPVRQGYIVRRLTPLECERHQGFPDRWTDVAWEPEPPLVGKNPKRQNIPHAVRLAKATDTGRYKACGNSVAVPCVQFIMGRIAVALTAASGLEEVAACDETGLP